MKALSPRTARFIFCFLFSFQCATTVAENCPRRFGCHHHGCPTSLALFPSSSRGGGQNQSNNEGRYEILEEKVLFKRWRTLVSRLVRYPDGRTVDFDVSTEARYL